jgi:hypothetical protein
MNIPIGLGAGAGAVALAVLASAAPAASAASTTSSDTGSPRITKAELVPVDVSKIKDFSGWHVEYWGPGYSSGTLDASIPADRDEDRAVPAKVREAVQGRAASARPDAVRPAATGFLCTLWVGKTVRSGGELKAGTEQTCTGAFLDQWTAGQFDRSSWTGWRTYSSVSTSPSSYNEVNDITFTTGCGSGGTYDYSLTAIPWATSSETGATVNGPLERGASGRHTCGT